MSKCDLAALCGAERGAVAWSPLASTRTRFWGCSGESFEVLNDLDTVLGARPGPRRWEVLSERLSDARAARFHFAHERPVVLLRKHQKTRRLFSADQSGLLVSHSLRTRRPRRVFRGLGIGAIRCAKIVGQLMFLGGAAELRVLDINRSALLESAALQRAGLGPGPVSCMALAWGGGREILMALGSGSSARISLVGLESALKEAGADPYHLLKRRL